MAKCPACRQGFGAGEFRALADHLVARAEASDPAHVRWLNQNLTRKRTEASALVAGLEAVFDLRGGPVSAWVKRAFVRKFFGASPHPFVVALQHPSRATLLGYVYEHQHFLRQWVRSCAYIMARTDEPDVVAYELENIATEFVGSPPATPSHYELLLRMGEGLGVPRALVLATPALPTTRKAIAEWDAIATEEPWVAALAALHALELIAHRDLVKDGASMHYFDPAILAGAEIPPSAQAFLREGYEADVGHSDEALALVDRFAGDPGRVEEVQAVFLRSIDLFDDYLVARLERAKALAA